MLAIGAQPMPFGDASLAAPAWAGVPEIVLTGRLKGLGRDVDSAVSAPDAPVVEVVVSGTITPEGTNELRRTVKALVVGERLERVLIDGRDLVHLPTAADLIDVAKSMSTTRLPVGFRAAHVSPEDLLAAMWTSHWVAASNNRGIVTGAFHTRDEAMDWLLSPTAARLTKVARGTGHWIRAVVTGFGERWQGEGGSSS